MHTKIPSDLDSEHDVILIEYIEGSTSAFFLDRHPWLLHEISNNVVFWQVQTLTSLRSIFLSLETPNGVHCWSHTPHFWKSHVADHFKIYCHCFPCGVPPPFKISDITWIWPKIPTVIYTEMVFMMYTFYLYMYWECIWSGLEVY